MMISDLDRRGYHDEARRCYDSFLHYQGSVRMPSNFKSKEGTFYGAPLRAPTSGRGPFLCRT